MTPRFQLVLHSRLPLLIAVSFAAIFPAPLLFEPLLFAQSPFKVEKKRFEKTETAKATPRYVFKKEHDRNGIGKFYKGREIAHVMGHPAAMWLERPEREKEERLSLLIDSLKLKPGMAVADIGAGSGIISVMMADEVVPGGTVYAVDIQKEMLDIIRKKIKKDNLKGIVPVLGKEKSPALKPNSVDLVVMVDVYHEFAFPYEMLQAIAVAVKPGGRIAFVEYRLEDPKIPIKRVHKMSEMQVKKEALQPEFGLKWKETVRKLPRQHVVIFEKKKTPKKKTQESNTK